MATKQKPKRRVGNGKNKAFVLGNEGIEKGLRVIPWDKDTGIFVDNDGSIPGIG
jgi:hypothetical protein